MSNLLALEAEILSRDFGAMAQRTFGTLEGGRAFVHSWSFDHLVYKLDCVRLGEARQSGFCVPPRSGKSFLCSVAWAMYLLGHDPTLRIICVSFAEDFARKLALDRLRVAQEPWYQRAFPTMRLVRSQPRAMELRTTLGGSILALGIGGAMHGRGADYIIIDDPLKGLEALSEPARRRVNSFFDLTLRSRLDDKLRGVIVIVMQRLHQNDLIGHVTSRSPDEWDITSIPAIATEDREYQLSHDVEDVYFRRRGEALSAREPLAVLEAHRRAIGSLVFETQYQQNPAPADGQVIRREWLRFYDLPPLVFERRIVSWDTASTLSETADWSVGTVWGAVGSDFYLLHVTRERLEPADLRRMIVQLSRQYQADATLIEDTELGRAIASELRNAGQLRPILDPPRFDKVARLLAQVARFEAGQVHLPQDTPWLGVYVSELLAFPTATHDDQVDSTSQALRWLNRFQPAISEFDDPVR